jgi:hypothetical protein
MNEYMQSSVVATKAPTYQSYSHLVEKSSFPWTESPSEQCAHMKEIDIWIQIPELNGRLKNQKHQNSMSKCWGVASELIARNMRNGNFG